MSKRSGKQSNVESHPSELKGTDHLEYTIFVRVRSNIFVNLIKQLKNIYEKLGKIAKKYITYIYNNFKCCIEIICSFKQKI